MTIRVKICGVTTAADARLCHEAGADLLGVILTDSPRRIGPAAAAAIRAAVPTARLVGVVRDRDGEPAALADLARCAGLDAVQLHGCVDPRRWVAVAAATKLPVLPAVAAPEAAAALAALRALPDLLCEGLLLDLPKNGGPRAPQERDHLWEAARLAVVAGATVFLAGSLSSADLPAVRRAVGPCHLDVCRGTERTPGVKDPDLVRGFLAAVRDRGGSA